jgi:fumarate reductase flavoprotein subunit
MTELECDVIVISAGTAGLAAAIAAAESGARVIAFEKSGTTGGTGNMASGLFAVESRLQKLKQFSLTREQAFKMHMEFSHWKVDGRLVKAYIDKSADTIDWLEKIGVHFEDVCCHGMGMNYTWHVVKSPTGKALGVHMMKLMADRAIQLGVKIYLKTPVKSLIKEGGRITGVIAEDAKGEKIQAKAGAVICAAGGQGGDFPDLPGNDGECIKMAKDAGAQVTEKKYPVVRRQPGEDGGFNPLMMDLFEVLHQPALMVNLMGERFLNEEVISSNLYWRNPLMRQKGMCGVMIFDEDIKNHYVKDGYDIITGFSMGGTVPATRASNFDEVIDKLAGGGTFPVAFNSLEELAAKIEIDLPNLRQTVEEYNRFCRNGRDEAYDKNPRFLREVKTPRFFAMKNSVTNIAGDYEGIRVNYRTEVISEEFRVIPGLYAAGTDAMCNVYYGTYPNILPGNNMGFCINTGRIAGENAAGFAMT